MIQELGALFDALSVLVIDDDSDDRAYYKLLIRKAHPSWNVKEVQCIDEAVHFCQNNTVHCALLDHNLQGETGLARISYLLGIKPELAIVVLTGDDNPDLAQEFLSKGATDYLPKSEVSKTGLVRAIQYAVQNRTLICAYRDMHAQAIHASQVKSSFLAALSHELRTPLNAIIGYSSCMSHGLAGELEQPQKKMLDKISMSGHLLAASIDDLLFVADSKLSDFQIRLKAVSLRTQCLDLIDLYAPILKDKDILVRFTEPDADPLVQGDPASLRRALRQVFDNAVRFSPQKEILITLCSTPKFGCVRISDQGPGICPEKLNTLYSLEVATPGADEKVRSGKGVGLPLAKAIIEKHKGSIIFCSDPALGTTCQLSLPTYTKGL